MNRLSGIIRPIAPEDTYALRHAVLRPHQSLADCAYPLDHEPDSFHVGYVADGRILGVGSVYRESRENAPSVNAWRIRGMAVQENCRGQGVGGEILKALISHAAQKTVPGEIWCNGRESVRDFYGKFGFIQLGEVFDLPPLGPHVLLVRALAEVDRKG